MCNLPDDLAGKTNIIEQYQQKVYYKFTREDGRESHLCYVEDIVDESIWGSFVDNVEFDHYMSASGREYEDESVLGRIFKKVSDSNFDREESEVI